MGGRYKDAPCRQWRRIYFDSGRAVRLVSTSRHSTSSSRRNIEERTKIGEGEVILWRFVCRAGGSERHTQVTKVKHRIPKVTPKCPPAVLLGSSIREVTIAFDSWGYRTWCLQCSGALTRGGKSSKIVFPWMLQSRKWQRLSISANPIKFAGADGDDDVVPVSVLLTCLTWLKVPGHQPLSVSL